MKVKPHLTTFLFRSNVVQEHVNLQVLTVVIKFKSSA